MKEWKVEFSDEFDAEFKELSQAVQDELVARAKLLKACGPLLGRPFVDTLNGSKHSNMKELRFSADEGVWRVAFVFDPKRTAIILIAGDKTGKKQKRFYEKLIATADKRFDEHLAKLES